MSINMYRIQYMRLLIEAVTNDSDNIMSFFLIIIYEGIG